MRELENKQVTSINVLNEDKHTNESVNTSSIEFIDLSFSDINSTKEDSKIISEFPPDKNGLQNIAESVNFRASAICKKADEDENSDAEMQLLKEDNNKRNSTILEDSEFSENDSESGSYVESVNTEVTVDETKSDKD